MIFHFTDDDFGRKEAPWIKHSRRFGGSGGNAAAGTVGGGPSSSAPGGKGGFQSNLSGAPPSGDNPMFGQFNQLMPAVQGALIGNLGGMPNSYSGGGIQGGIRGGGMPPPGGGSGNGPGGIFGQYQAIANGNDPRYQNFYNDYTKLQQFQKQGAVNQAAQQFANTGMGNSSAAMNQENLIGQGYDLQNQALASQLGLGQIARQDQALGQESGVLNDALQNTLAKPALQIAGQAAQNAGRQAPSGGKGRK